MPAFRKLPPRYAAIVMPFFLSVMMCFIVSGISTARTVGIGGELPGQWLRGWGLSWLVAFPSVVMVMPLVRRITACLVDVSQAAKG